MLIDVPTLTPLSYLAAQAVVLWAVKEVEREINFYNICVQK